MCTYVPRYIYNYIAAYTSMGIHRRISLGQSGKRYSSPVLESARKSESNKSPNSNGQTG